MRLFREFSHSPLLWCRQWSMPLATMVLAPYAPRRCGWKTSETPCKPSAEEQEEIWNSLWHVRCKMQSLPNDFNFRIKLQTMNLPNRPRISWWAPCRIRRFSFSNAMVDGAVFHRRTITGWSLFGSHRFRPMIPIGFCGRERGRQIHKNTKLWIR